MLSRPRPFRETDGHRQHPERQALPQRVSRAIVNNNDSRCDRGATGPVACIRTDVLRSTLRGNGIAIFNKGHGRTRTKPLLNVTESTLIGSRRYGLKNHAADAVIRRSTLATGRHLVAKVVAPGFDLCVSDVDAAHCESGRRTTLSYPGLRIPELLKRLLAALGEQRAVHGGGTCRATSRACSRHPNERFCRAPAWDSLYGRNPS